ncbi:MAG TPA: NAD-dependent epimerase/dehydratase family protein [Candidatus Dormibacteraeota bacterium]|nr:NAD-dependent epimerase/dehydratase family protein [Candidatus Dormibacteraeota bacterium]
MTTVLVTGAAGFIGSHVSEALIRRGDRVVGLDSFDTFYEPARKRRNIELLATSPSWSLVEGDIRSEADLHRAWELGPWDAVVHLAARAGVRSSIDDPLTYIDVNVAGTARVLEFARRNGCRRILLGSSSSVYGSTTPAPFSEDAAAATPSSPYAATKRSNELTARAYHEAYGFDVTVLRFFTVYGPRQRPDMAVHRFTAQIDAGRHVDLYGDGASRRDYTYVADIVDGVVRALDRCDGWHMYNLGTTVTTPLLDLATMIAERLGRELRVRHLPADRADVPLTHADISRARRDLGYDPSTPVEEGLARFVAWYRAAGASSSPD